MIVLFLKAYVHLKITANFQENNNISEIHT